MFFAISFGEARPSNSNLGTAPMLTDKLFTGQRLMADLGIYHYGARFCSPRLGRFLSADTIAPGYANPQNLNRYSYVGNNPLRYTDSTGHGVDCGIGDRGCRAGKMDPKRQLFEYNAWLIGRVRDEKMNDLEAFSHLVDRAASLTPNCTQCFVNNLGAILTGHSGGNSAWNELVALFQPEDRDPFYRTGRDYQLDQSGFDSIFQDLSIAEGGNPQPHHYWFFVQVGYESGGFVGYTGVLVHETIISSSLRGMSAQDQYLGYEGVDLGASLAAGTINISEIGDYIRRTLSPGSENAVVWRLIHERNVR